MKKQLSLFFVLASLLLTSCLHISNRNTEIRLSESDHYYSMKARFSHGRTRSVEYYMDRQLGRESNMSFVNTRIDGRIAFNDHTNFYIKKYPGYLQIRLDKDENSNDSYQRVREMCEGIKDLLGR